MQNLERRLKNYFLIKYAQKKLKNKENKLSKEIPWIKRKHLSNTVYDHCNVLLDALINKGCNFSFRESKFIVDKILKYSYERGENLLRANQRTKAVKPYLQLNSYIMYEEIINSINENKSKKAISFNIEKQLSQIQEKIKSDDDVERVLNETLTSSPA